MPSASEALLTKSNGFPGMDGVRLPGCQFPPAGVASFLPRGPLLCPQRRPAPHPSGTGRGDTELFFPGGHRSVHRRGPLSVLLVTSEDCFLGCGEGHTLASDPWGPQRPSQALLGTLWQHSSREELPSCPVGWVGEEQSTEPFKWPVASKCGFVKGAECIRFAWCQWPVSPVARSVLLPRLVEQG